MFPMDNEPEDVGLGFDLTRAESNALLEMTKEIKRKKYR